MTTSTTVTRVTCRWDDQAGVEPGWYCESWDGDTRIDDSQKVWFAVAVDDYGHEQAGTLREALKKAFPAAEIIFA